MNRITNNFIFIKIKRQITKLQGSLLFHYYTHFLVYIIYIQFSEFRYYSSLDKFIYIHPRSLNELAQVSCYQNNFNYKIIFNIVTPKTFHYVCNIYWIITQNRRHNLGRFLKKKMFRTNSISTTHDDKLSSTDFFSSYRPLIPILLKRMVHEKKIPI